jgi:hypothetical protein
MFSFFLEKNNVHTPLAALPAREQMFAWRSAVVDGLS